MKKVALTGHSGSGKTTLANFIAEEFFIPFVQGSAGLTLTEEQIAELKRICPEWQQSGHKEVIKLSNTYPEFGFKFQEYLFETRTAWQADHENFVTDRCALDNLVYFLLQVGHQASQEYTEQYMHKCLKALENLTHIIYIQCSNPGFIEYNGSRIPNLYYQEMVDGVFQRFIFKYLIENPKTLNIKAPKILVIRDWDLEGRKNDIVKFLKGQPPIEREHIEK